MRVLLLVFLLAFSFVTPVFAVSTATESGRGMPGRVREKREAVQQRIEEHRAAIQNRIEERREQVATRVAEIRQRIAEHRRVLIRNYFRRMLRRFEAAIARMRNVGERIERRLDRMEERGIDVSALREDLAAARSDLDVADGMLDGLEAEVEDALASDDPKAAFEVVRDTVHETREMLKDIHQELVEIIRNMKGPNTPVELEATQSATESAGGE